jgi:hypothetical protein
MAVIDAAMHPAVYSTPVVLVGGVDWGIAIGVRHKGIDRCYAMQLCASMSGDDMILQVFQVRLQRDCQAMDQ